MSESSLPPCGLYKTRAPIGSVPAGRLVYFHNHGNPGPGVYLPTSWVGNRARFAESGVTLPTLGDVRALEPIAAEGFYRVATAFHCCPKQCRLFERDLLVQLGYDGTAAPLLFVPELVQGVLGVPDRGTRIDDEYVSRLVPLKVPVSAHTPDATMH